MNMHMAEDAWWCVYMDIPPQELLQLWVILVYVLPVPLVYQQSVTSSNDSQNDILLTDSLKESLTK